MFDEWFREPEEEAQRAGVILVAGDKSGVSQKRFYKQLIAKADALFDQHLALFQGKEKRKEK